jgi:hypothetical protein
MGHRLMTSDEFRMTKSCTEFSEEFKVQFVNTLNIAIYFKILSTPSYCALNDFHLHKRSLHHV